METDLDDDTGVRGIKEKGAWVVYPSLGKPRSIVGLKGKLDDKATFLANLANLKIELTDFSRKT